MASIYNNKSLAKHNVTQQEVDQVVASFRSVWIPMSKSTRGFERVMIVGFTNSGRLLEVGVELFLNDDLHYFHADNATKVYKREYELRTKHD